MKYMIPIAISAGIITAGIAYYGSRYLDKIEQEDARADDYVSNDIR